MCGQTFVPFAGPRLWNSFHEVSLQLADASMVFHQVLVRLIKVLLGVEEIVQIGWEGGGKGEKLMKHWWGDEVNSKLGEIHERGQVRIFLSNLM